MKRMVLTIVLGVVAIATQAQSMEYVASNFIEDTSIKFVSPSRTSVSLVGKTKTTFGRSRFASGDAEVEFRFKRFMDTGVLCVDFFIFDRDSKMYDEVVFHVARSPYDEADEFYSFKIMDWCYSPLRSTSGFYHCQSLAVPIFYLEPSFFGFVGMAYGYIRKVVFSGSGGVKTIEFNRLSSVKTRKKILNAYSKIIDNVNQ